MTRLLLACAAWSAWVVLLFLGYALGGAVHGLLALGLAVFPWRSGAEPPAGDAGTSDP